MQIVSSRIWTRVTVSLSNGGNHGTANENGQKTSYEYIIFAVDDFWLTGS